jgi:cytochrome c peroxidase
MSEAMNSRVNHMHVLAVGLALAAMVNPLAAQAGDATAASQLAQWQTKAGAPASFERGKTFFTSRHGGDLSCASCHGTPPTAQGKHASTGKLIEPLAPAINPTRFTDTAKVNKWFTRNCKDVLSRECSASEKADVLAYLAGLKP